MKLALLGTGMIVQEVLPLLEELGIRPVALLATERSRERGEDLARKYRIPHLFFDYTQLLESDVDTVYIGLPNKTHYEYAREALLKNKHVIVEKPMVASPEEFEKLRDLAGRQALVLAEAMTLHYLPAMEQMKRDLPLLGKLRLCSFHFCKYSSRYDAFLRGEVTPAFDPALDGGALMDLNVYNLHAALYLFGPPQEAVYTPNMQRGVDTSGVLTLDYGDMKAVCTAAKDCQGPNQSFIAGEKGWLEFQGPISQGPGYVITLRTGEVIQRSFGTEIHRMTPEFLAFQDRIDKARPKQGEALLDISGEAVKILSRTRPY